ncbi:MAG: pyridoxine 5'-phosphate synthase [Nitrospirales bacterium]|nr:pyridoxine 5'-phosphate synthase [Nitrospirales bacterium]
MPTLGVNIDHVATLRQARGGSEPDPLAAAVLVNLAGADGIVVHLREDRRHIQERDLRLLRELISTKLNLEMAADKAMVDIALNVRPDMVTLVPEQRQELTTEGGLDIAEYQDQIKVVVEALHEAQIAVSLFIDPDHHQIHAANLVQADAVELHTGRYAHACQQEAEEKEYAFLSQGAQLANTLGLIVNAGHGLTYRNISRLRQIPEIVEYNIGHSIVARAVLVGMDRAVKEMKALVSG